MSNKMKKKLQQSADKQAAKELASKTKVFMKFDEDKYYNDLSAPMFRAGEIYSISGDDWIGRWLKRGGKIVESSGEKVEEVVAPAPTPEVPPQEPLEPVEDEEISDENTVEIFNDDEE